MLFRLFRGISYYSDRLWDRLICKLHGGIPANRPQIETLLQSQGYAPLGLGTLQDFRLLTHSRLLWQVHSGWRETGIHLGDSISGDP